ncbi:MAG: hypothetical protein QOG88_796 [Actinomycetota bacterium]|jgi:hypothetical protein|nr:hypothetical protein [Actinomycetota bacterium]
MAQGGSEGGTEDPGSPEPGLGALGFGWGTDPKTGAYRYGQLGANGFLVPGTGEVPPNDADASRSTGNIPISRGSGWGLRATITVIVVIVFIVIGVFLAISLFRVNKAIGTVFGDTYIDRQQLGAGGVDFGGDDRRAGFGLASGRWTDI